VSRFSYSWVERDSVHVGMFSTNTESRSGFIDRIYVLLDYFSRDADLRRYRRRALVVPFSVEMEKFNVLAEISKIGHCQNVDPDVFFNESGQSRKAKAICQPCPVRESCRDWAIEHQEIGIWGGTTTAERNRIRHISENRRVTA